jgi:hypothetical protein
VSVTEKVTVALDIHAVVEVSDEGYLGLKASVQEHIDKAVKDAKGWRYFIQQGTLEPQPIRVSVEVRSVAITPAET